jgi:hypothetical protein
MSSGKVALLWTTLLTGLASCSSYDPSLIEPRRDAGEGGMQLLDATPDGDVADADGAVDEGPDCVEAPPGSGCARSCRESCNELDDDCDGRVDEGDARSSCRLAFATSVCAGSMCLIAACDPGHVDCNAEVADGCEATLDSVEHCGSCNDRCELVNASVRCEAGRCEVESCADGWGDCDGNGSSGCEQRLDSVSHCGACGSACDRKNAVMRCDDGGCVFVQCEPGFGDCNQNASSPEGDGCETPLDTPEHCGSCELACSGTTRYCSGGRCTSLVCDPDRADCDADNMVCETNLRSITNCGACGATCGPLANAAASCGSGQCTGTCDPGFRDCDNSLSNGCETNVRTLTSCGGCGTPCAYANAATSCTSGSCSLSSCNAGYGNCNGLPSDGCETRLNTTGDCGQCGRACNLANAAPSCSSGACRVSSCNSGFGNCDGRADNGCEVNLANSNANCGSCNFACPSNRSCSGGRCVCTSNANCASGQLCCGGSCVDPKSDEAACGACGTSCASGQTCCGGSCRNVQTDFDNCGGCNERCSENSNRCTDGRCRCTNDGPCGIFSTCCSGGCELFSCN